MNNSIVFFRYLPLTKKVRDDFYMNDLVFMGYRVEYWDLTRVFYHSFQEIEEYVPDVKEGIYVRHITRKSDLANIVNKNKGSLFVSLMTFEPKLIWIFRIFKRNNCITSVFSYCPLPLDVNSGAPISKSVDIKRILKGLYYRVAIFCSFKFGYILPYDYVFTGGRNGWKGIGSMKPNYLKNTRFFEVNNWDYDKFIALRLIVNKEPFIVFLDEYYPFHPDVLMNGKRTVTPERYFDDLNKVFSAIEVFYGMPVVIAAHPKALKYKDNNYFCGREVCFNSTLELVSRASFVLAHDSLSIGYAVMCKKQIIFINSNEIKSNLPHNYNTIISFSKFFHSPLIFADDINTERLSKTSEISPEVSRVYEEMVEDYMSSLKEPQQNVVLLKSYLQEIFNNM